MNCTWIWSQSKSIFTCYKRVLWLLSLYFLYSFKVLSIITVLSAFLILFLLSILYWVNLLVGAPYLEPDVDSLFGKIIILLLLFNALLRNVLSSLTPFYSSFVFFPCFNQTHLNKPILELIIPNPSSNSNCFR